MLNSRKLSARYFNVLKKILSILGCIVFLFSIFSPFCFVKFPVVRAGHNWETFWSYKFDYDTVYHFPFMPLVHESGQYWISDYWSISMTMDSTKLALLIPVFAVQVLTLIFGSVSVFINRRILSLTPVLLSLTVLALMTYTGWVLSRPPWNGSLEYPLGYYLAFPPLFLFLAVFIMEHRQEKNSSVHNLPKNIDIVSDRKEA